VDQLDHPNNPPVGSPLVGLGAGGNAAMASRPRRAVAFARTGLWWSVYALIVLFAVFVSFKTTFSAIGFDPDSSESIMLWYGIKAYGWRALTDWLYTSDNWLLSIVPLNFLSFYLFGPRPMLIMLSGWLVLAGTSIVAGFLSAELGARRAALVIPPVLLCVGLFAQAHGFFAYPVSHNVTNLYGLGALWLLLIWTRRPANAWLAGILALLAIGALSDPWMTPAYILPFVFVGVFGLIWPRLTVGRWQSAKLLMVLLVTLYVVKSHFFRCLDFLPAGKFVFGTWPLIENNAIFLIKDLGGLFNVIPGAKSNAMPAALLSLCLTAAAVLANLSSVIRMFRVGERQLIVFLVVAIWSSAAIIAAFVLANIPAGTYSARFLVNVEIFAIISFGVMVDIHWATLSSAKKLVSMTLITVFTLAGLVSTFPAWGKNAPSPSARKIETLIHLLRDNGLTYGYGPYQGSGSLAVTALTANAIKLRPITFNPRNGLMSTRPRRETFPQWYTNADLPPGQNKYFVIVLNDGEECADVPLCLHGLVTQFGKPEQILADGAATIMVWTHSLLGYPYDVQGDYWGGSGWAWMGRHLQISTRDNAVIVSLKGSGGPGHLTNVDVNLDQKDIQFHLLGGQIQTVTIPANTSATFTADWSFVPDKTEHNGDFRALSLFINLPQPLP
jgi:hypothetical protein